MGRLLTLQLHINLAPAKALSIVTSSFIVSMETFLSASPLSFAHPHLQSINEVYTSMPFSLLVQEQDLEPPFPPSSPSLDMETALQHLHSSGDTELSSSPNSSDDSDVLMVDPFLDYLNEVLMEEEEGQENVPYMQHDAEASYHAIVSSLYDIIGGDLPHKSASSESISSSDLSDRYASSHNATILQNASSFHPSHPRDKSSHHEERAETTESFDEHGSLNRENRILDVSSNSLPACGDADVSLEQEKIGTSCVKQETVNNFSSQAHHVPLKTVHVSECAVLNITIDSSLNSGRNVQDHEQTSNFDPSNDMSTAEPSNIDILPEVFKDDAGYADLYIGKPSIPDNSKSSARARSLNGNKKRSSRGAQKGSRPGRNVSAEAGGFVDLRELLVSCAQAVAIGDGKKASEIMQELYQVHGASAKGNGLQRTVHYFCEALLARMGGIGWQQYRSLCERIQSTVSFLRASRIWYGCSPYMKLMHYFANQNILKAAEGASRLHILDYGISYGMQWPCLINALADREGGPPLLVITGIDCSKPVQNSLEWLEESGRRLAVYARTYNVPFQFHAILSDQWEEIDPASLHIEESEVLVINCMKRLRHHADESVDLTWTISPRQKLLMSMRSLSPHLLLIAEVNLGSNSPFFVSRFREALYFHSNMMDMLDTVTGDNPDRLLLEMMYHTRDILNVVACEGAERVNRPEMYRQWDLRIKRAGFELLPIPSVILSRSRSYVKKHHHKDFLVHDDANGWMLLGWKGRTMLTLSAWKPSGSK